MLGREVHMARGFEVRFRVFDAMDAQALQGFSHAVRRAQVAPSARGHAHDTKRIDLVLQYVAREIQRGQPHIKIDDRRPTACGRTEAPASAQDHLHLDRKSTRLNSSHAKISYAVFCLKKK